MALFVSLEGLEGSGKTTIAHALTRNGDYRYVPAMPTSGTALQRFRAAADAQDDPTVRMLAYLLLLSDASDRIRDVLNSGRSVVTDSFYARTVAGHRALGADPHLVPEDPAVLLVKPHVSVFLDVPENVRLERLRKRRQAAPKQHDVGRWLVRAADVASAYREHYVSLCDQCVDAGRPEREVLESVALMIAAVHLDQGV